MKFTWWMIFFWLRCSYFQHPMFSFASSLYFKLPASYFLLPTSCFQNLWYQKGYLFWSILHNELFVISFNTENKSCLGLRYILNFVLGLGFAYCFLSRPWAIFRLKFGLFLTYHTLDYVLAFSPMSFLDFLIYPGCISKLKKPNLLTLLV